MSTVGAADLSVDLRCHSAMKRTTQTKVVDECWLKKTASPRLYY